MGCNMCVVKRQDEQYRVLFQQKGWRDSLRPIEGRASVKVRGRLVSQLPLERPQNSQDPLHHSGTARKSHRRKTTLVCSGTAPCSFGPASSVAMVRIPDCADHATQTDLSFQSLMMTLGSGPAPAPPALRGTYGVNELYDLQPLGCVFDGEFLDLSGREVDRREVLEYEVELYKSSQEEKLGLTVCYRTDEDEDLGIYVGEVNPNSIAAKNGRIKEGDRILQINGVYIQNREDAVAILSREDSVNFSLLLARPDIENHAPTDPEEPMKLVLDGGDSTYLRLHTGRRGWQREVEEEGEEERGGGGEEDEEDEERGGLVPLPPPLLGMTPLLSTSQDLDPDPDSGLGRTDDSPRCDESSNTNTNIPGSMRGFRHSPRPRARLSPGLVPSPRRSPGLSPSPRPSPSPGHGRGESTPPLLHLQLSTDSLLGLEWGSGGGYSPHHLHHHHPHQPDLTMLMMMPGLTEEECERYRELLEIKCQYERSDGPKVELGEEEELEDGEEADANCNETLSQHEMALLEEELRHLEFKCRNILRAQKMQQLRERCMKAWMMEEESGRGAGDHREAVNHDDNLVRGLAGNNDEDEDDQVDDDSRRELSAINEAPERERWEERDSTSAYNTGGESCQNTPLVSTEQIQEILQEEEEEKRGRGGGVLSPPPLLSLGRLLPLNSTISLHHHGTERERRHSGLNCSFSPNSYRKYQTANGSPVHGSSSTPSTPSKFRSLSREAGSHSRRGMVDGGRSSGTGDSTSRTGGGSAESSPYFNSRHRGLSEPPERYQSCLALPSEGLVDPLDRVRGRAEGEERGPGTGSSGSASPRSVNSAPCGFEEHGHHRGSASRLGLALPLGLRQSSPTASPQRMEWKVKIRSDGTRYVAKRPVRDRLLKARAMKIREERSGMTTDDDAASEMKQGRYWSREERKQQLLRAREYRRRREFMMQSRLDYVRGDRDYTSSSTAAVGTDDGRPQQEVTSNHILLLSQKKLTKRRNRRILDNWITIQELLAHGSRSPDGKKIYNPLLSVTTV